VSDFFPPPNIPLIDLPAHHSKHSKRKSWEEQLSSLPADTSLAIRTIANNDFSAWSHGECIDIYKSMEEFSWRVLLGKCVSPVLTDRQGIFNGRVTPRDPASRTVPFNAGVNKYTVLALPMIKRHRDTQEAGMGKRSPL
jgi:hypothetical protein